MAARNKNKDPSLWLKQKRGGQAPSAATAAMFKAESDGSNDLSQNFAPNGRRLRTVRREDELFGDDDDEGGARRRRADGADADFEEIPYHEEFADDEEKMGVEEEEDEVEKEMEVNRHPSQRYDIKSILHPLGTASTGIHERKQTT